MSDWTGTGTPASAGDSGLTPVEMINIALQRYGLPTTDSTARARMLYLLNQAQRQIWGLNDWWFKRAEGTITFTSGTKEYNAAVTAADVLGLWDATGVPLTFIPYPTFQRLYAPQSATGVPSVWTKWHRNTAGSALEIAVYPAPTIAASGAAKTLEEIRCEDMVDSVTADNSLVPPEHREVIIMRALRLMALQDNKPNEAQLYQAAEQEFLAGMQGANKQHRQGAEV